MHYLIGELTMRIFTSGFGLYQCRPTVGFKLSDIIVNLCSKLLDYTLLKSGSISGLYFI